MSSSTQPRADAIAIAPPRYGIGFADQSVQRMGEGSTSASGPAIQQAAQSGVTGSGQRLPHFDAVQRAFGSYDVRHVQAHTGPRASSAARSIGASAYAIGSRVAFASSHPTLHEVAHEAAHALQQQAGVQLHGGVGQAGDRYEQHAEAVARATTAGRSAEPLLREFVGSRAKGSAISSGMSSMSSTSAASPAVQCITKGGTAKDPTLVSQLESGHPVVAPGSGYIRAIAKTDASSFVDDHAWVVIEYVRAADNVPITVVTDLRKNGVKFTRDGNAVPYASSLMNEDKYLGTTYAITQANAEAAIAKGEAVSAGFQFDEVKSQDPVSGTWSTNSVPRADNKYTYNVTGKATFMPGNRVNCARYASKLLKAAGIGSGWFEVRPRGGWFFKTPGQVAGGLFGQTKN
ncbi:DUF4157 domain-containing protein [Nannocystaceae bacterium ST9]